MGRPSCRHLFIRAPWWVTEDAAVRHSNAPTDSSRSLAADKIDNARLIAAVSPNSDLTRVSQSNPPTCFTKFGPGCNAVYRD